MYLRLCYPCLCLPFFFSFALVFSFIFCNLCGVDNLFFNIYAYHETDDLLFLEGFLWSVRAGFLRCEILYRI